MLKRREPPANEPPRISPEAVALFARVDALADQYANCLIEPCSRREHCDDCRGYLNGDVEICRLLGVQPWETSPVDVEDEAPAGADGLAKWERSD